ncbi:hypothetical protein HID58_022337 [Brassica napus]|uniref:Uncharacterized protein n=1 Tax=Brassica napus TaxID=3708 RepID=A0ABQ8CZ00_BRANA|nr:hypothetical protein HID58_022337 [Brassica napus]
MYVNQSSSIIPHHRTSKPRKENRLQRRRTEKPIKRNRDNPGESRCRHQRGMARRQKPAKRN